VCGSRLDRDRTVDELVHEGALIPVHLGPRKTLFHMPASAHRYLEVGTITRSVKFLGPLDSLLWDRRAVREIFGFDYIWEVYKRPQDRRWGYYVLPVLWGDRLVARIDSRLENGTWKIAGWWWEDNVRLTSDLLSAVRSGARRFSRYLGASGVEVGESVEPRARAALAGE
jgi:uncharacterized protein